MHRPCGIVQDSVCLESADTIHTSFCEQVDGGGTNSVNLFNPPTAVWTQVSNGLQFSQTDGSLCHQVRIGIGGGSSETPRTVSIDYICNATAVPPVLSSVSVLNCLYSATVLTAAACPSVQPPACFVTASISSSQPAAQVSSSMAQSSSVASPSSSGQALSSSAAAVSSSTIATQSSSAAPTPSTQSSSAGTSLASSSAAAGAISDSSSSSLSGGAIAGIVVGVVVGVAVLCAILLALGFIGRSSKTTETKPLSAGGAAANEMSLVPSSVGEASTAEPSGSHRTGPSAIEMHQV